MNHRSLPYSSFLSSSTHLQSNNANNNSRVYSYFWNILSFLLRTQRGWNIFPRLAVREEGAMVSIIPSEYAVSPRCPDLAPPLSNRTPNTKVVAPAFFVQLVGVWFATGRKKKAFQREPVLIALPLMQSISFKHSRGEARRSGSMINMLIPMLNMLNMDGRILPCLLPSLFPCWMTRLMRVLAPVPYPACSKLPHLKVRDGCYSEKSWSEHPRHRHSGSWSTTYWLSEACDHEICLSSFRAEV